MNKKVSVGIIIAILVIGAVYFFKPAPAPIVYQQPPIVGAIPGNEVFGPEWKVNGYTGHYNSTKLKTGTTTVCSLKSPGATSTLVFGGINYASTTSTTTATVYLAKSTSAYGTSSTAILGVDAIANTARRTITATTSIASGEQNEFTFGPSQYFLVIQKPATVNGGDASLQNLAANYWAPTGFCEAEWAVY